MQATWLLQRLADLSGFEFSEAIQEDYGWGFWVTHGKYKFWIAMSCVGGYLFKHPLIINFDSASRLNAVA